MGIPVDYCDEIAALICSQLAEGKSLAAICREEGLPSQRTVYNWLATNPGFLALYTQAREDQADALADGILDIADDRGNDVTVDADGKAKTNREVIERSKLRVDARKWIASKLKPKKYGDKLGLHGTDDLPPLGAGLAFNAKYGRPEQAYFALAQARAAKAHADAVVAALSAQEKDDLVEIFRARHPDMAAAVEARRAPPLLLENSPAINYPATLRRTA